MRNLIFLLVFAASFIIEIYLDLKDDVPVSHIWHEGLLFLLASAGIGWQLYVIFQKNIGLKRLSIELLETQQAYQAWKAKTRSNANEIRQMIDQQFSLWHLSPSEKDVALLLIKGFSMKEIADFRSTHEKTVRQQATTIYKKSSLSGRQELAAFFLEDILSVPETTA